MLNRITPRPNLVECQAISWMRRASFLFLTYQLSVKHPLLGWRIQVTLTQRGSLDFHGSEVSRDYIPHLRLAVSTENLGPLCSLGQVLTPLHIAILWFEPTETLLYLNFS